MIVAKLEVKRKKIKMTLLVIWLLSVGIETAMAGHSTEEFDLVEYYFKSVQGVDSSVHCDRDQIDAGLLEMVFFGEEIPGRRLLPSYYPLEGNAAWYVSSDECPSQKPFYNGVGFESFSKKTGAAVIYIAAFRRKAASKKRFSSADVWGRMQMIFQPDFEVANINRFEAKCEFENGSFIQFLLGRSNVLVCTFEGELGFLKLLRR